MSRKLLLLAVVITVAVTGAAHATTLVVDVGGSGGYTEIQPALNASSEGDTVLVMPGTYTGDNNTSLDFVGKNIVLRGTGGARSVVIDCENSRFGFLFATGEGPTLVVEGLTVTRGYGDSAGGAINCRWASPTFIDCMFTDCVGEYGAVAYIEYGSPAFTDCVFSGNEGEYSGYGGCVYIANYASVFTNCTFSDNTGQMGGAIFCDASASEFINCTFTGNSVSGIYAAGGSVYCDNSAPLFDRCTFSGESAELGGGAVHCWEGSPQLTNCIIAFCGSGPAVECEGVADDPVLICCDLFGNAGGDWVGCIADQGATSDNMSADPLFCDAPGGNFTLDALSPCAEENSSACGQVGALGIGCDTPVHARSWGSIKELYR